MTQRLAEPAARGAWAAWAAFLVMAFLLVGLVGIFATFAAPLPLQRALARETALDQALAAAHGPDPAAAVASLAPVLDDSAAAILPWDPAIDQRIARERGAMRRRLEAEAQALAIRLRWLIGVLTVMAAAFGVAVLRASRRAPA